MVARTDSTFELIYSRVGRSPIWIGKCIHCKAKHVLAADGEPISAATLEHINPRCHGGSDELNNLAIACESCNQEKGHRHDKQAANDPKRLAQVATLHERRRMRWRDAGAV
jgi:5-methylcytosine-specific restriction endonuclease McrA